VPRMSAVGLLDQPPAVGAVDNVGEKGANTHVQEAYALSLRRVTRHEQWRKTYGPVTWKR
jgi:hypothetical protein